MSALASLAQEVREDLAAAQQRDPAARSVGWAEMLLTYRGVQALLAHRVSHALHSSGVPLLPRVISFMTTAVTGVEIHPAARIGRGLFIDHGVGVVIGETAEVGDDVLLFHGVTLGGRSMRKGKRHPTLGDHVTVGAGAKILGPVSIGSHAQIGANAVVISDVPADHLAVGIPVRIRPLPGSARDGAEFDDPAIYI